MDYNVTLPSWVANPTLPGYTRKQMVAAILSFMEAHQILVANDSVCAKVASGYFLNHIVNTLQLIKDKKGEVKDRLAHFYAGHTETILSVIRLMRAEDVQETPTSAGFILEYADKPEPSVRFLYHRSAPNDFSVRLAEWDELPYCPDQQWCSLDKFIDGVKNKTNSDWRVACKLPKCPE